MRHGAKKQDTGCGEAGEHKAESDAKPVSHRYPVGRKLPVTARSAVVRYGETSGTGDYAGTDLLRQKSVNHADRLRLTQESDGSNYILG